MFDPVPLIEPFNVFEEVLCPGCGLLACVKLLLGLMFELLAGGMVVNLGQRRCTDLDQPFILGRAAATAAVAR